VDAYTRYFRQTISNFEAQYQGREFRVGRPWDPTEGESDANSDRQMQAIIEMISNVGLALRNNFGDLPSVLRTFGINLPTAGAPASSVDEEGFRHFEGRGHAEPFRTSFNLASFFQNTRSEAATFFTDLADAMGKDLAHSVSPNDTKGWSIS
jgi:hypothetical protein